MVMQEKDNNTKRNSDGRHESWRAVYCPLSEQNHSKYFNAKMTFTLIATKIYSTEMSLYHRSARLL